MNVEEENCTRKMGQGETSNSSPAGLLLVSCPALLLSKTLLEAILYITSNGIFFYTVTRGRVSKEALAFKSLAMVKKCRGGRVANAIKLYLGDEYDAPVIIGSLSSREEVFNLI